MVAGLEGRTIVIARHTNSRIVAATPSRVIYPLRRPSNPERGVPGVEFDWSPSSPSTHSGGTCVPPLSRKIVRICPALLVGQPRAHVDSVEPPHAVEARNS
jgi:hypothetical protein